MCTQFVSLMKSLHIFIFLIMFQEYRNSKALPVFWNFFKKLICFDLGFDPGLQQAKQACKFCPWTVHPPLVSCAVCVLLAYNECFIRKYPSAPAVFKAFMQFIHWHGDGVMSASILWKHLKNLTAVLLKWCFSSILSICRCFNWYFTKFKTGIQVLLFSFIQGILTVVCQALVYWV